MFDQNQVKEIAAKDLQDRLQELRDAANAQNGFTIPQAPINLNIYKDIAGTIDLHIHSLPCFSPRLMDDIDVALQAQAVNMRAVMLKGHSTMTPDRATLVQRVVGKGTDIYGMICLNTPVGGMNPSAVSCAIAMGAKAVWMPSMWAENHAAYVRSCSNNHMGYQTINMRFPDPGKGEVICDSDGKIKLEVLQILDLVAQADIMLSNGHLDENESLLLMRAAKERGIKKLIIHTANYHPLRSTEKTLAEFVELGCMLEFGFSSLPNPIWGAANPEDDVTLATCSEWMRRYGLDNCVLTSDVGQVTSPTPIEAMRMWYAMLKTKGFSVAEIDIMTKKNPAFLLGLPEENTTK